MDTTRIDLEKMQRSEFRSVCELVLIAGKHFGAIHLKEVHRMGSYVHIGCIDLFGSRFKIFKTVYVLQLARGAGLGRMCLSLNLITIGS